MQFRPIKKAKNILIVGTNTGNFVPKLQDLNFGSGVFHAEVKHDSWCSIWASGHCNCNPDIETKKLAE